MTLLRLRDFGSPSVCSGRASRCDERVTRDARGKGAPVAPLPPGVSPSLPTGSACGWGPRGTAPGTNHETFWLPECHARHGGLGPAGSSRPGTSRRGVRVCVRECEHTVWAGSHGTRRQQFACCCHQRPPDLGDRAAFQGLFRRCSVSLGSPQQRVPHSVASQLCRHLPVVFPLGGGTWCTDLDLVLLGLPGPGGTSAWGCFPLCFRLCRDMVTAVTVSHVTASLSPSPWDAGSRRGAFAPVKRVTTGVSASCSDRFLHVPGGGHGALCPPCPVHTQKKEVGSGKEGVVWVWEGFGAAACADVGCCGLKGLLWGQPALVEGTGLDPARMVPGGCAISHG